MESDQVRGGAIGTPVHLKEICIKVHFETK